MANKVFVIFQIDNGIKHYYCYTSLVGVTVMSMSIDEAREFTNGNYMRREKNRLNKEKTVWYSEVKKTATAEIQK
jgi:hypothetical protein